MRGVACWLALALFAGRDTWDQSGAHMGVAAQADQDFLETREKTPTQADQDFLETREKTPTGPGRRAANFNRKKSKRRSWGSMFGGGEDGAPSKPCVPR